MAAILRLVVIMAVVLFHGTAAVASGHGPVFGATTPTLGTGAWSVDQTFTIRSGDDGQRSTMVKTMVGYGFTEELQLTVSLPLGMRDGNLSAARMMSLMSSDKEIEGLLGYRFHKRPVGVGGRFESTFYGGGTLPFEVKRGALQAGVPRPAAGGSLEVGIATGYASRAHYMWVGGGLQWFFPRKVDRYGSSRLATVVYGYRPPFLRTEAGKPDLRFFGEATLENRSASRIGSRLVDSARTAFAGPTALLLYKQWGVEGGVLFPVHTTTTSGRVKERWRAALNVSYFFWPGRGQP